MSAARRPLIELERARDDWARSASPTDLEYMLRVMSDRRVSSSIIARVRRLNPDYQQGFVPRGIHYQLYYQDWQFRMVTRGRFIREYGRAAWQALPRAEVRKHGRRCWVRLAAVVDQLWLRAA